MNPFKTPQFKALAKEWNEKLVKDGHKEIEDFSLPDPPLYRNEAVYFKNMNLEEYNAKLLYFGKARALLHTFTFLNETHRRVWELYSEGMPMRKIAKTIGKKKLKKSTVFNILQEIRKEIK